MKRKTIGVDPKVPVQGLATAVLFVAGFFGLDLDAEVATAIAVVIGALISAFAAPAPQVAMEVKDVPSNG